MPRRMYVLAVIPACIALAAAATSNAVAAAATTAAPAVSATTATSGSVVIGDQNLEPTSDNNAVGEAQAWAYDASVTGTVSDAEIYIDAGNSATTISVGLYSDAGGEPGKLLASGTLAAPQHGAWNDVALPSANLTSGTTYWLALLGTGGTFNFRDNHAGSCSTVGSQFGLSSIPSSWHKKWTASGYCPASFYLSSETPPDSGSTGTVTTPTTPTQPAPTAPSNTSAPTISGTAQEGSTVTASSGSWSGTSPITYRYSWSDGTTSQADTLSAADVGKTVTVTVTATNSAGTGTATASIGPVAAAPPTQPAATPPSNTSAPTISGTAQEGSTVTASSGSWSGTSPITYRYSWSDGTTGQADSLSAADVGKTVTVTVTATNSAGTGTATASIGPVAAAPLAPPSNTSPPTISGVAQQGNTLTASSGSWSGTSPITYQYSWSDGATGPTDSLSAADVGNVVSVTVTATNSAGTATAMARIGPVAEPSSSSVNVTCPLTHNAGADPNNSCWATHTGVLGATGITEAQIEANPTAVGFTKHVGDLVITQPNTTIDHEWIDGCIQIADGANNVTIKDSLITSGGGCSADDAGGSAINTGQGPKIATNTLIEDDTVDGGTPPYGSHDAGITVDGGEVLRVNLFGFAQGYISDANTAQAPALFQDDYAHDFYGCSHDDGTWFNTSSYVTFEHGWVMTNDPTQPSGGEGCSTGALTGGSDYGPQNHVVFDDSYGEGVTGEDTHAGCGSTNSAYTNNVLSSDAKDYGSGFVASDIGNVWAGNVAMNNDGTSLGTIGDPQGAAC